MHHVRTGRTVHELREVADVDTCTVCGQRFERGLFTMSWRNCGCTDGTTGHRLRICLRDPCRAETPDPPCRGQYGATATYGSGPS